MSLKYEPSSEPLHITVFLNSRLKALLGPVSRVLNKREKNDRSQGGVDGLGAQLRIVVVALELVQPPRLLGFMVE